MPNAEENEALPASPVTGVIIGGQLLTRMVSQVIRQEVDSTTLRLSFFFQQSVLSQCSGAPTSGQSGPSGLLFPTISLGAGVDAFLGVFMFTARHLLLSYLPHIRVYYTLLRICHAAKPNFYQPRMFLYEAASNHTEIYWQREIE